MSMNADRNERRCRLPVWLLTGCVLAWVSGARAQAAEGDIRRDPTVTAVERVLPSVVNIATETIIHIRDPFEEFFRQFWDPYHRRQPPNSQYSLGSGVVIDEEGYLLTNDHVVRRADKITIKFCTGTNSYTATVVASDPKSDVALLKLNAPPGQKFKAIQFAREDDLLLGETVLALGNPFGLGGSVSRGILSSKSRVLPKEGQPLDIPNWLQTVFPTEFVKAYWFGARVKVGAMPLVIASVQPQSPAGRAGLKPGDVILQVNGKPPKSFIDFADLLATGAGADEMLAIRRGTMHKEIAVRLVPEKSVFNAGMIREKLGLNLEELTPQLAARYGLGPSDAFFIAGVQEESPAAAAGLQRGILVTAFDGQLPSDLCAAAKLLYARKKGDRVQLEIAVPQRMGNFGVLRQGAVELVTR